jgi:hypothetical protein
MTEIRLSETPKGNGYQTTVSFPDGVFISSAESCPRSEKPWRPRC